ncbi:MAG: hypothetical protein MJE68_13390 [Proteobacteria bacterium]|nr:hypothetical protein [Pseudomonadota bacterium]
MPSPASITEKLNFLSMQYIEVAISYYAIVESHTLSKGISSLWKEENKIVAKVRLETHKHIIMMYAIFARIIVISNKVIIGQESENPVIKIDANIHQ